MILGALSGSTAKRHCETATPPRSTLTSAGLASVSRCSTGAASAFGPLAGSAASLTGAASPSVETTSRSCVPPVLTVTTLPAGSRVVDAIRKAGGARPGVDLTPLNLARVLVDGEQILVGAAAAPGVAASAASQPGAASDGALVNLNTATLEQLDTLPGVGPVTARRIVDWRAAHGAFTSIDELLEVDGIGEKTLADMAPRVTL